MVVEQLGGVNEMLVTLRVVLQQWDGPAVMSRVAGSRAIELT